MDALTVALALALGPGDLEDPLPRSLSEAFVQAAPAKREYGILVGGHLGGVERDTGDDTSFVVGAEWRIRIQPWLAVGGTIDYQTQPHENPTTGAEYFQFPFMWSFLFSPPIDLGPFRPYVQAGGGFTVTYISGELLRDLDLTILYFAGVGTEVKLSSNLVLDAGLRYVKTQEPIGSREFSADWGQFTVGLLYKLTK